MTRKDFELIAYALNRTRGYAQDTDATDLHTILARTLASALETTNPRFDSDKFLEACGLSASERE